VNSRPALSLWLRRPAMVATLAALLLTALLSGGLVVAHAVSGTPSAEASPAPAGNGGTNVAGAVNTTSGKTVYAIRLKIVQTTADTVSPTNAAVAVNSGCTGCTTVAVAFEGVVVVGSPSTFTPTNLALAYNVNCSGCTAFADAYQQVVQTSTRVRITKEGRRQIAAIRKDLKSLKKADLSIDQIRARVAADEKAFAAVLRTELVPVGHVKEPAPADAGRV
jgi:putative peptide zinc metalloprotease protein